MDKYIRQIDSLGRIVIPAEYRILTGSSAYSAFMITFENQSIVLRPIGSDHPTKKR